MTTDATVEPQRRDILTELYFAATRGHIFRGTVSYKVLRKGIEVTREREDTRGQVDAAVQRVREAQSRQAVQALMDDARIDYEDLSEMELSSAEHRKLLECVDAAVRIYTLSEAHDEFIDYMRDPAHKVKKFLREHGICTIPLNWIFDRAKIGTYYQAVEKIRAIAAQKLTIKA